MTGRKLPAAVIVVAVALLVVLFVRDPAGTLAALVGVGIGYLAGKESK